MTLYDTIDIVWKRLNFGSLPSVYELALFHVLQYILAVETDQESGQPRLIKYM